MRILSVVGARPQFIKLAPVDRAIRERGHEHIILHTGQHYAAELSENLFIDLGIPEPDVNLSIGSGSHAKQTAAMMVGIEEELIRLQPDWVLVYGDTNSTIAAAIAASKIHIPIAHLEAGLRSFNRIMPEELNRIATDHLADLLLAPSETAMGHLADEGLTDISVLVGDVMVDVCLQTQERVSAEPPVMPEAFGTQQPYYLATIHRAENTDDPARLAFVLQRIASSSKPVLLIAHPRLVNKAKEFGIDLQQSTITVLPSLSYSQMVYAVSNAEGVLTDSGGLQKEAFILNTPCLTARTETEWSETARLGWNKVDPHLESDFEEYFSAHRGPRQEEPFGTGDAAERTVIALETHLTHK